MAVAHTTAADGRTLDCDYWPAVDSILGHGTTFSVYLPVN